MKKMGIIEKVADIVVAILCITTSLYIVARKESGVVFLLLFFVPVLLNVCLKYKSVVSTSKQKDCLQKDNLSLKE